ncbi:MAG: ABC transporter ATP-binding protein [Patescibacteria group bacterium]|nr:ABC transporter ATP-binding protein [Patescibacteria group bacterium]
MSDTILSVSHLSKEFDLPRKHFWERFYVPAEKFKAVNNISFEVKEGEIVGLLGPNGAGKTTTIYMLLGLLKPSKGKISVFNLDFSNNREAILEQMNFSSAYNDLPYKLTVWENLYVFGRIYKVDNLKHRIETLIKVFELEDIKNQRQSGLSAGQKAKLNMAKAFINKPRLVLLDEPTASLDPDIADKVRRYLLSSQEKFKTTMLITSHNMAEVEEICDRVIFINHGKIIDEDTPEGLAKKIKSVKVTLMIKDGQKRTLNFAQKNQWQASAEGRYVTVEVSEDEVAWLLAALADKGVEYSEISIDKPSLEDYFLKQTRGDSYEMA